MNMKFFMICIFSNLFFSLHSAASESSNPRVCSVIVIDISDDPYLLGAIVDVKLSRGIESYTKKLLRTVFISTQGREFIRAAWGFRFDDGSVRYIGVLPHGATLHKAPSSPDDTLGYQCTSGNIVYVPLSEIPTTRYLPNA